MPVRRTNDAGQIAGYQIAYYHVTSAEKSARVKVSFASASNSDGDTIAW